MSPLAKVKGVSGNFRTVISFSPAADTTELRAGGLPAPLKVAGNWQSLPAGNFPALNPVVGEAGESRGPVR